MTPSRDEALAIIRARAVRREAIATAVFGEMLAMATYSGPEAFRLTAKAACVAADLLIVELDARRQAEEAQA